MHLMPVPVHLQHKANMGGANNNITTICTYCLDLKGQSLLVIGQNLDTEYSRFV